MKKQIIVIHGGDSFNSYKQYFSNLKNIKINFEKMFRKGWKDGLPKMLGKNYQVIMPSMPNKSNARFEEWKIWFEKLFPFLNREVVLVGHSLGASFLLRYLSENKFPKKIKATFLVSAPYQQKGMRTDLGDDFRFGQDMSLLIKQSPRLVFYQSQDDKVVPVSDFEKFKDLFPGACFVEFKDRGHFGQENFPEIVRDIKKI
ncbi:MAG TPA: alpha/beta hydrolase [Candidatus Magasanikbacteria bacterium]|nr:alpha/beta hydrolase [Candidatus Magasanikbacteria bacterium]